MQRSLLHIALLALLGTQAQAEEIPAELAKAEVIGGWTTESGTRMAALRITLAPGWKTYWRAPGDAGIPPVFDWSGSENLGGVAFHWPTPDIFDVSGLRTIGYHDQLVLPMEVAPSDSGRPTTMQGVVQMGVCEEVCVPVTLAFQAELPGGETVDPLVRAALADQPRRIKVPVHCAVEPIRDGLRLTATIEHRPAGTEEFAVIEMTDGSAWVSPAATERQGDRLVSIVDLVPPEAKPFALDRSRVRLTLFGTDEAVEVEGCTG